MFFQNRRLLEARLQAAWRLYEEGDLRRADDAYRQCLERLGPAAPRALRVNLLMGASYVKSALGEHGTARALCEKLVQMSRPRKGLYVALHQSALIEKAAGDERAALQFLDEEEAVLRRHHKKETQKLAICLYERAGALAALHDDSAALDAMKNAVLMADTCGDETTAAYAHLGLGELYEHAGDKAFARLAYQKAAPLFREAEDEQAARNTEERIKRL